MNNNLFKGVTSKSLSQQERNHKIFFSISKWVETTNREQKWIDMDFISFLWKKIQAECYEKNKIWRGSLKPTACFLTNKRCISGRRRTRHYILAGCGLSLLDFPLVDDILNFIQFCFSSLLHRVVGDRQRKVKGVHWTSFDDHGVPTFFFYYLAQVLIGKICQFYLLTDLLENNPRLWIRVPGTNSTNWSDFQRVCNWCYFTSLWDWLTEKKKKKKRSHPLNQSYARIKPISTGSSALSHTSESMLFLFFWLLLIYSLRLL